MLSNGEKAVSFNHEFIDVLRMQLEGEKSEQCGVNAPDVEISENDDPGKEINKEAVNATNLRPFSKDPTDVTIDFAVRYLEDYVSKVMKHLKSGQIQKTNMSASGRDTRNSIRARVTAIWDGADESNHKPLNLAFMSQVLYMEMTGAPVPKNTGAPAECLTLTPCNWELSFLKHVDKSAVAMHDLHGVNWSRIFDGT